MSNQSKTEARTYNLHISGYGFLNRAREVESKIGGHFLALDITALEGTYNGDWNAVNKTRFSALVVGRAAKAIVAEYMDQIKDRETTVTAAFTLSGCRASSFAYRDEPGKTGVALHSRLLKISWLKVGDEVIDLELKLADEDGGGAELAAPADREHSATDASCDQETPASIKLDPEASDFQQRKAELKEAGYRWNGRDKLWTHPDLEHAPF